MKVQDHFVFLSYPWKDEEVGEVRSLVERIRSELEMRSLERWQGYQDHFRQFVWLDMDRLAPDVSTYRELQLRLGEGVTEAQNVLSFVSPHYWDSGWCRFEWGVALGAQVPLMPIVWKGNPDYFPPPGFVEYLDARKIIRDHWDGYGFD